MMNHLRSKGYETDRRSVSNRLLLLQCSMHSVACMAGLLSFDNLFAVNPLGLTGFNLGCLIILAIFVSRKDFNETKFRRNFVSIDT